MSDGGPAFPLSTADYAVGQGMSLRDWFAGQVLQGILAGNAQALADTEDVSDEDAAEINSVVAEIAYNFADAMLKARDQPPRGT